MSCHSDVKQQLIGHLDWAQCRYVIGNTSRNHTPIKSRLDHYEKNGNIDFYLGPNFIAFGSGSGPESAN